MLNGMFRSCYNSRVFAPGRPRPVEDKLLTDKRQWLCVKQDSHTLLDRESLVELRRFGVDYVHPEQYELGGEGMQEAVAEEPSLERVAGDGP
jgi:hypothetical protein